MTFAQRFSSIIHNHSPAWIFIGGFLIHVGIMYPGFLCYDAVHQILEARAGVYSDWHPPLMAIIWRVCDRLLPGSAGMLILQLGLVWFGSYLVFRACFQAYAPNRVALLLSSLLFLPPIFGISGAILKDVLMWGCLLTAFGSAAHIQYHPEQAPKIRWSLFAVCVALLWLAILLRHNAFFATIPILSYALYRLAPKTGARGLVKIAVPGALIALSLFIATGWINKQLADRHTSPWVANAAFDVAGVLVGLDDKHQQQELFNQLASQFNATGSVEPLLKAYTPMYWREIFRSKPPTLELPAYPVETEIHGFESLSDAQLSALKTLWRHVIVAEPLLWMRHRLAVSNYVLGLVPGASWSPTIMAAEFPRDLAQYYGASPQTTALQAHLESILTSVSEAWFMQPWPYFILVVATFFYAVFLPTAKKPEILCLTASAILHELGLMLAAPSPDFRYSHYMIFCSLLSLLFLLRPLLKSQHKKA